MNNYIDNHGRVHDKAISTTDSFPSNNSFAYSGYASLVGIKLDTIMIRQCWNKCQTEFGYNRNPDNKTFPLSSHDEVVGMFMLEDKEGTKALYKKLEQQRFQVCNLETFKPAPIYKLNPFKVAKDFYNLSKEENARKTTFKFPYIAPIIFRHMPQNTYFYARCAGVSVRCAHTLYWFGASLATIFGRNNSSKVMLGYKLLKLKKLGQSLPEKIITKLFNLRIDFGREVMEYFPTAHPIVVHTLSKLSKGI